MAQHWHDSRSLMGGDMEARLTSLDTDQSSPTYDTYFMHRGFLIPRNGVPHLRSSFGEDLTDGEVEDIEGSKCRLDDAEQALAVVWLEALGVERIEGGETLCERAVGVAGAGQALHSDPLRGASHLEEDEQLEYAPEAGRVGVADEHEQLAASSEVDRQRRQRLVDLLLVDAGAIEPHSSPSAPRALLIR